jgi:hypothetical protein
VFYENTGLLLEEMKKKDQAIENWKTYLIYLDDALAKEKVQKRVDALERGEQPGVSGSDKAAANEKARIQANDNTRDLQREIRGDAQQGGEVKTINTKPVDISNDFQDLNKPDSAKIDLKSEAKKRSKK